MKKSNLGLLLVVGGFGAMVVFTIIAVVAYFMISKQAEKDDDGTDTGDQQGNDNKEQAVTDLQPPKPVSKTSGNLRNAWNKCLAVPNDNPAHGAPVIQWDCTTEKAQNWSFVGGNLKNAHGQCLAVPNNNAANGSRLIQYDCNNVEQGQQWTLEANGNVKNGWGKCLAVPENSSANSVQLMQWDCDPAEGSRWSFA